MCRDVMTISVNGDDREVPDGITVAGLLADLGLTERRVAVAVNRDVVTRSQHAAHALGEGDRVEVVHAVQGG